jgi:ribonuclease P protein component
MSPARPSRSGRRGRLSRSAEFDRVYRHGRSTANRELVLYAFPNPSADREGGTRVGLSVSRKVGGAVQRNKVKRLLREALAHHEELLPNGHDLVVVARPDALQLAERDGLQGIGASLGELLSRSGSPAQGGADAERSAERAA